MMPLLPSTPRAATPDLPFLPPLARFVIASFFHPILAWVETLLLRRVLFRCFDHPLVQLALLYDPAPVVALCADYYHAPGTKGAPPTFSVELLLRAEIVRAYSHSCSDRQLECLLLSNLLVRFFVGIHLLDPVPDHSTLNRFHDWLSLHHPDLLFRDVLTFLERVDPENPASTPQIVDTFALQADAAWAPRVSNVLLDLCADLIDAWHKRAPSSLQHALPPLDLGPIVHPARPQDALDRQALLVQASSLAQRLLSDLTPFLSQLDAPVRGRISRLLEAIAKVIADELTFDADGTPLERKDNGSYRIISASDLDASFRKHDDLTLGYNVAIATSATRIRAVVVMTGATPDNEAPVLLAQQQLDAKQPLPPYIIMDRAGGWGKCRARVDIISEGRSQMVALIPPGGGADPTRFGPADFVVDAERTICTCPNGVTSTRSYSREECEGVSFRFLASQCRGCPLWQDCRGVDSNPKGHRTVFISDYHAYLRRAAEFNSSEEGQLLLSERWRVEPTIAWLTRYQGCRRARRIGQQASQFQLCQGCAVRNLLLWLSRVRRGEARAPAAA
jgi:hypothetical protein